MQILHIDTGQEMRGGQYQVLLLLQGLRGKGHEPVLLAREGTPLWHAAKAAEFCLVGVSAREIWRWSQTSAVVHAHDAKAHTLAALASRARFIVSRRVGFRVKRTVWSRWKYRRAAAYLAVSEYVRNELLSAGVSPLRVQIVYDGVAPTSAVESWNPADPIVALQSADPGKMQSLAARATALAGVPVVFSTDLPNSLRRASAFLYLTRSEGLGSGALLAMSMGVPVIASRVGGLAEVFIHGSSGLYVSNDAEEIAAAIHTLLSDRQLALRLREGGVVRVAERFSAERMVTETIRAYERAVG